MNTTFAKRCVGLSSLLLGSAAIFLSLSIGQVNSGSLLTVTPVPTRIPLPEAPETLDDVQALMRSNGGCQLPCFWGFRPGYTTVEEILAFVQPEEDYSHLSGRYEIAYFFTRTHERDWTVTVQFNIDENLLSSMRLVLHEPSEWLPLQTLDLPHFLSEMESSPEAYLSINTGRGSIFLTLVYDEAGIVAQYSSGLRVRDGVLLPDIDKPVLFCPILTNDYSIDFWLNDGNARELLEQNSHDFRPGVVQNHTWPVERMTRLDTEDFIEQIITYPNRCIEMLSYAELVEEGYEF